ncbi:cytochrome c biogenesis protein [Helicobacter sp. MIT 99-10781]|uniref:cytochrome c biogenesis protein n=1 Tax=Helicobacter sp. MIT 99-10781 TaxID=1332285 RepID=UPI002163D9F6|nr:cytochrome c biogenesis protein CcsA [Helicobacter sp. MIT 99-10781]
MKNSTLTRVLALLFANMPLVLLLIAIYAIACGVATFIESAQGSLVARASVYGTWWFEMLHIWLLLSLIGCFLTSKSWQRKKYASLALHFSFILIIFGAGVTRYAGFEGTMPIKNEQSSNRIYSSEPYLIIQAFDKNTQQFQGVEIEMIAPARKYYILNLFDEEFLLKFGALEHKESEFGMPYTSLELEILESKQKLSLSDKLFGVGKEKWEDATKLEIIQSQLGDIPEQIHTEIGEKVFIIGWGSKVIALPFKIYLDKFVLDRYPGSQMPSSYASFVKVEDSANNTQKEAVIFMNNVLDYGGYRFFQSSYFPDESGTILSVNNDPGKLPTYIGYALLMLSCIWLLFDKNSRFSALARFVKSKSSLACASALLCLSLLPQNAYAQATQAPQNAQNTESTQAQQAPQDSNHQFTQKPTQEEVEQFIELVKKNSKAFSEDFGKILMQDFDGRIKPLDTIAADYIHKMTGKDHFLGLSNTQLFLAILVTPEYFKEVKLLKSKSPELRELLGNDPKKAYIAPIDAYLPDGTYILANYVERANQKPLKEQNTFDKDVIEFNEKLYVFGLIYSTKALRVLPDTKEDVQDWHDFDSVIIKAMMQKDDATYARVYKIAESISRGFSLGVTQNNWDLAYKGLELLQEYQKEHGSDLLISPGRIKAEIWLNKTRPFERLTFPYLLFGFGLFIVALIAILRNKAVSKKLNLAFYALIALCFVLHSAGLVIRWYVSGHAPWSNAYESMLYIAWAAALSGVVFFRKSSLALCSASFLAGITLFVANLGDMNPQIGNLVPVLKSYWLNIHVSVITASYGFLGLCFVLGIITLVLFTLRSPKRKNIEDSILSLSAINEMSMLLGLFLLTAGNFLGAIWANESWGRYWGWDPKETWALISIGVYAIILHLRFCGFKNMPLIFASASVLGFFSVLMTYFGVNYFLVGMHSYAQGEAASVPWYIYAMVACVVALIALAVFKNKNTPLELKL